VHLLVLKEQYVSLVSMIISFIFVYQLKPKVWVLQLFGVLFLLWFIILTCNCYDFFWFQSTSCLHFTIHCTFNLTNCDTCMLQCIWVGPKMKEEKELILYPNKNGTVADLLEEARKQVELSENGSGKLRYISTLER